MGDVLQLESFSYQKNNFYSKTILEDSGDLCKCASQFTMLSSTSSKSKASLLNNLFRNGYGRRFVARNKFGS